MSQSLLLKATGLNSFVNQVGPADPQGALQQADNITINRDGVIEQARGFKIYGSAMGVSSSILAKQLFTYKQRILRHFQSTLEWDDGTGTFTAFPGSFSETETGLRIKGLEANGNFYFTTSAGMKKISAASASAMSTATVSDSGAPKALDMKLTINSQPGFLFQESVVAYRHVWGIKDQNNNLILSTPSQREIIDNPLQFLLGPNFNTLLSQLDVVGAFGLPDITDTDYHSSLVIPTFPSANDIQTGLSNLCTKLDEDMNIKETSQVTCVADVSGNLNNKYFGLSSANDAHKFLIYYNVAGTGVAPVVSGFTSVKVDLNTNDSAATVASKTRAVFSTPPLSTYFTESGASTQVVFTNLTYGPSTDTQDGPIGSATGFTFLTTQEGLAPFANIKAAVDAITISSPATSGELVSLQTQFELIVAQLNSYIGVSGHPTITSSASSFTGITTSSTVNIEITIPENITTAWFCQVYRTAINTSSGPSTLSDAAPGDEMRLVYEVNPTQTDIDNGYLTFIDIVPEAFRGADLYTNPNSGEGLDQANEPPPKAKDICLYKNYLFYANTENRYRKQFNLLSVSEFVANTSQLTITDGTTSNTYTFSDTEDPATKKVLISDADTPAQQVDETARSLVHVINRNDNEIVYAYYLSGPTDVPGIILFESRGLGGSAFYATVNNSNISTQFSPSIPTSGNSFIGDNEVSPNRIYYSKVSQPEAVPLVNYFDVGPKDKKILRILALRESLFVLKQEGIYRISGDIAPFVLNLFDSSTILTAPDTADILNNQIYCLSSQGVATISDTGVSVISRPIENQLIKLNTPNYAHYTTASFGRGYEADRTYYLWTVTKISDTVATQCFTFNTFTNAWCRRPISKTCAVISSATGKMYLGAGDINFIEEERKDFSRTDFANREYNQVLGSSAVNGKLIKIPSVAKVNDRDVILQTQYLTIAQYNRILNKLDMDLGVSNTDYEALLSASHGDNLRTKLTSLAIKLDADPGVNDSDYAASIVSYGTTFPNTQDAFNVIVTKLNADLGVAFSNYPGSTGTVTFETIILSVDKSISTVTTENACPFIEGTITTFEGIESQFTWCPQTFGDPSSLKQVSESTVLFEKITFSEIDLEFSTDLLPGFEPITFEGSGNGIYGNGVYGENNYGGMGNSIPFRTLVPRNSQRCRYINCRVTHKTARESYSVFGLSLTGNITSTRAYR